MRITGVEHMVFNAPDLAEAKRFCLDYGLDLVEEGAGFVRFEALDGTSVEVRHDNDSSLLPPPTPQTTLRLSVWGVKDRATLDEIRAELSKDREVTGTDLLVSRDDDGFAIGFRVNRRRQFDAPLALVNTPGYRARPMNDTPDFNKPGKARVLGHIVLWSADPPRAMRFYTERLGFKITDALGDGKVGGMGGIFARSAAHSDHHSLFILGGGRVPENKFHHVEFQFKDFHEVMVTGQQLSNNGWKTHMGPGRHLAGGNWYWYFYTPMGGAFEVSADMDQVDDNWQARSLTFVSNQSLRPKWEGPQFARQPAPAPEPVREAG